MIEYLLVVWGLTHILVSSRILSGFRDWLLITSPLLGDLVSCYQCSSFWLSILLYFFFDNLEMDTIGFQFYQMRISLDFLFFGFLGSGVVSFLSVLLSLMIAKSRKDI